MGRVLLGLVGPPGLLKEIPSILGEAARGHLHRLCMSEVEDHVQVHMSCRGDFE